jgi:enterochelin esterase-like enzyme
MGYSTGGYCAANLAIRHADRFSAAVSLSGYFHAITDHTTGDLYKSDEAARQANTPTHTIGLPRRYPLNFYLATGGGDPDGLRGLKELAAHIRKPDRLTEVVVGKGGHNFGVWRRALPEAFVWIGMTEEGQTAAFHPSLPPGYGSGRGYGQRVDVGRRGRITGSPVSPSRR